MEIFLDHFEVEHAAWFSSLRTSYVLPRKRRSAIFLWLAWSDLCFPRLKRSSEVLLLTFSKGHKKKSKILSGWKRFTSSCSGSWKHGNKK
jgi:hypothetical protein